MSDTILSRSNLYQTVTTQILDAIKSGPGSFKMPWHASGNPASMPLNASTDASYRGVNVLSLWIAAMRRGYPSGTWASYRQWASLGAQVRKGERGTLIVFYKHLPQEPGEEDEQARRFVLKSSYVFNAAQVEGWTPPGLPAEPSFNPHAQAEAFVEATKARMRYGFHRACYRRDLDDIEMPSPAWFTGSSTSTSLETYYATLLHELTHWTGATHRLRREFGKRYGDNAYAFEELVAELGAAFLCAELGIANEPRTDHAAYLGPWLKVLEQDSRAIFRAASLAQQAVEYLTGLAADNT
jgi:antirestriction protein ArdC